MKQHSERRVYCFGEVLLDIIFPKGEPVAAKVGGSMLNTAVSLARTGIDVKLISEIFPDEAGNIILRFLKENNISTDHLIRYNEGSTPVALAFLNDAADAEYTFYKSYPEERLQVKMPVPSENDVVLFGSIYSLTKKLRRPLLQFLENARKNHALIIYDPNFRKKHSLEASDFLPMIRENISFSDIVRGSDEDFHYIFAVNDPGKIYSEILNSGGTNFIYTRSQKDVSVMTANYTLSFPVPEIKPVSTIGAGDSFNAGLISGILQEHLKRQDLQEMNEARWKTIINSGISFAQAVCLGLDNYISGTVEQSVR